MRNVFHETKFKLTQFEKGGRQETSEINKNTVLKEYLDTLRSATSLGFYPFQDAERELDFALKHGEAITNIENFPSMLRLM